ncbi:MAG: biotin/lipoyl-containing protein [Anaerolineae bacterium]|jgi:biotin carboxyl carrier protein
MKYRVTVEGRCFDIEIDHDHLVRVDGRSLYVDLEQVGGLPLYSLALDDEGFVVFVEEGLDEYRVEVRGEVHPVQVQRQRPQLSACPVECARDGECLVIRAPLAGYLLSLPAAAGQRVRARQPVAIVESMKMQMELRAPQAALVEQVHGPAGRKVCQGEELVVLRADR